MKQIEQLYQMFEFLKKNRNKKIPINISMLFKDKVTITDLNNFSYYYKNTKSFFYGIENIYHINNKIINLILNKIDNLEPEGKNKIVNKKPYIRGILKVAIQENDIKLVKKIILKYPEIIKDNMTSYFVYDNLSIKNIFNHLEMFKIIFPILNIGQKVILASTFLNDQINHVLNIRALNFFIQELVQNENNAVVTDEILLLVAEKEEWQLLFKILNKFKDLAKIGGRYGEYPTFLLLFYKHNKPDLFKAFLHQNKLTATQVRAFSKDCYDLHKDNGGLVFVDIVDTYLKSKER